MGKKYIVELKNDEEEILIGLIASGTQRVRKINHAHILQKTDDPGRLSSWSADQRLAGGQFCDHRRWLGRTCQQSALKCGRGNYYGLADYHSCQWVAFGRHVLADCQHRALGNVPPRQAV